MQLTVIEAINCRPAHLTDWQITGILRLVELCFHKKTKINYLLQNCDTYVLSNQTAIVALVQVEFETQRRYWLQHVCTHPDYRNQGYMKQLLIKVMADLPQKYPRIRRLHLEVIKSAIIAKHLYQSLGFKAKGHHMKYGYRKIKGCRR